MDKLLTQITPEEFVQINSSGFTILHLAGKDQNLEALDHLRKLPYLEKVINYQTPKQQYNPIMKATQERKFDSVKMLFEMGSNPLLQNSEGINCIHIAAANNDVQVLNFLLKKTEKVKGVVNLKSNDGWTAAHLAAI